MRRCELIAFVGGAAAWPLAARTRQPVVPVVDIFTTPELPAKRLALLHMLMSTAARVAVLADPTLAQFTVT
jgi:hypothetical protein